MAIQRVTKRYASAANSEGRTESRWHVTVREYPSDWWGQINTLCGYVITGRDTMFGRVRYSKARRPIGTLCSKCEKKLADNGLEALRQAVELITGEPQP